jgi:hypothetical protein
MSSTLTWNLVLIVPFLLAFIGIPLWMTVKHLDRAPDHTAARRYLAAKGTPITSTVHTVRPRLENELRTANSEREPVLAGRN